MAPSKKGALKERRTIAFVDEAAFYLLPGVVATWAPEGETPILTVPLQYDHLSAIAAVTPAGGLFVQTQESAFNGADVVRFLRHLAHTIGPRLLIGWDGATIHRNQNIKAFLATPEGSGIRLFSWPGYAPELDPTEGVWHYCKYVELANVCNKTIPELKDRLSKAMDTLTAKPQIIRSFFNNAKL